MLRLVIISITCFFTSHAHAQGSDFIMLKKRNRTVQNFFAGSNIEFMTTNGAYRNGLINKIKHDSIFIQEFIVQRIPTTIGTFILDTVGSFRYAYDYRQIRSFGKEQKNFNVSGSGAALLGGGILLTLASGVIYLADREKFSGGLMATSAGLATAGYFMSKSGSKGIVIGKKGYRLQYMGTAK
ncbi:hypothetical protein [Ferruginibacter sp. HRS2-29]|uniref:hypothetical protein n=1 Tax=Ferruginibacter sp. HRS2-29 TaxID=2487334 RepID=UPI0020CC9F24|nr:hypothetical protein [Ferruginibacter sp. HRS2-29]MCP9752946.1 hypothetical protein [Ferruginibacter sp. HRS2-29]